MENINKYLTAARQALQQSNYEDAMKYYDMVKLEEPTNAEAKIQFQYAKFCNCTNGEAYNCYNDYIKVLQFAVENVSQSNMTLEEQLDFLSVLQKNSFDAFKDCSSAMERIRVEGDNTTGKISSLRRGNILFARDFGDAMEQKYATSEKGMQIASEAWKSFVKRASGFGLPKEYMESLPSYVEKIKKVDPSFDFVPKKRGCLQFIQ